MKKILTLALFTLVLTGCGIKIATPPTPDWTTTTKAEQFLTTLAPIIQADPTTIKASNFEWRRESNDSEIIKGYTLNNAECTSDYFIPLTEAFKARTPDMHNMADWPWGSLQGYFKGNLYCLVSVNANASIEELMAESEEPIEYSNNITIQCGEKTTSDLSEKKEDEDSEVLFEAFGEEPFRDFTLKGDLLSFNNYMVDPEFKSTHKVVVSKEGDMRTFHTDEVLSWAIEHFEGRIIKKNCSDTMAWFSYPYVAEIDLPSMHFEGCAFVIQEYAEGDDFFKYQKTWPLSEFIQESKISNIEPDETATYTIDTIQWPYVTVRIWWEELALTLVMKKTPSWWETIWEGQDIDYESCKKVQAIDSALRDWSIFRSCTEDMARG